jgi:hypothetical protein
MVGGGKATSAGLENQGHALSGKNGVDGTIGPIGPIGPLDQRGGLTGSREVVKDVRKKNL